MQAFQKEVEASDWIMTFDATLPREYFEPHVIDPCVESRSRPTVSGVNRDFIVSSYTAEDALAVGYNGSIEREDGTTSGIPGSMATGTSEVLL